MIPIREILSQESIASWGSDEKLSQPYTISGQAPQRKILPHFELTRNQKRDLKEAFDHFDIEGTGCIGVEELKISIRALGYETKKEEIEKMLKTIDKEGTGKISFSDYVHLMSIKMTERDSDEDFMKSFRLIDTGRKGKIIFEDLKLASELLREDLRDEQIMDMIDMADQDGDGVIGKDDFLKFMQQSNLMSRGFH